jgi:hypothetical protein
MRNLCLRTGYQKVTDEFAEVIFQVDEWPWEIITRPLHVLKTDFGEVY